MPFPLPPGNSFRNIALSVLAGVAAFGCQRPAARAPAETPPAPPAAVATAAPVVAETKASRGKHIALLHAANIEAEYEVCGCPSHPLGGLARRATVIDEARVEADGVLVVDAGDLLLPTRAPGAPPPASEVERRARLLLEAYARMGLNAFLPAERDLQALGPQKLKQLLKSTGVPAVASNLVDRAGRPFFEKDRLVTVAGVPIGVFGLLAAQPEDAASWKSWALQTTSPEAAARAEVASLRARGAQMIVALVHVGPAGAAHRLVEGVPGIDWAVQGHVGMQIDPPTVAGSARLLDTLSTGKFAGRVDIHVVDGARDGLDTPARWKDRGQRAELLTIIADHRQQLADLARRAAADKSGQLQDFHRQRREAIQRALDDEVAKTKTLPEAIEGSWYEARIIPLDETIPDQASIAILVAAYNAGNARLAAAGKPVGLAPRGPSAPPPPPDADPRRAHDAGQEKPTRYAGSALCTSCHPREAAFFATTKHARALDALAHLKPAPRDHDPTCIGCHTTGFMQPGGTWSVAIAATKLRDVGCESCHGPSLGHISLGDKKTTTHRQVPEIVCRGCHTPDRTNGEFDDEAFTKAILGPGHGA